MKAFVPQADRRFTVRGTEIRPDDTPEQYLHKLAHIALQEMFELVSVLNCDGIVLECNRARDDVRGRPFAETFWWSAAPKSQADLRDAIGRAARGEFVRYTVEVLKRQGGAETMTMDFTLLPIRDDEGRVALLLAEGRDISGLVGAPANPPAPVPGALVNVRGTELLASDPPNNTAKSLRESRSIPWSSSWACWMPRERYSKSITSRWTRGHQTLRCGRQAVLDDFLVAGLGGDQPGAPGSNGAPRKASSFAGTRKFTDAPAARRRSSSTPR